MLQNPHEFRTQRNTLGKIPDFVSLTFSQTD